MVISDNEAIRRILMGSSAVPEDRHPRYAVYLGAGASAEANVKPAREICEQIFEEIVATIDADDPQKDQRKEQIRKALDMDDPSMQYLSSITAGYPLQAMRVEYFRRMLRGVNPSFAHHAAALLISRRYFKSTCLTTNFDKLLESAFIQQGQSECQPLRTDQELKFWLKEEGRYYVLKLHGDYDTHNISNTTDETVMISEDFRTAVADALESAGLVVLGTAGNEKSIHTLFDFLSRRAGSNSNVLRFGLLWGVYMGSDRPKGLAPAVLEASVEEQVKKTIGRDITRMMMRTPTAAFFPMWGTGNFMYQLIGATNDPQLLGMATLFLDREMRVRQALKRENMSDAGIKWHIDRLRAKKRTPTKRQAPVAVATATRVRKHGRIEVSIVYGDITSRTYMSTFEGTRMAVVSPDDTLLTAGGGVAEGLLAKAGPQFILNELAKFGKIEQGQVVVTSGGNLPVEYVFHAAALQVQEEAYAVSKQSVYASVEQTLQKAEALDVQTLWVPLMGTGAGTLDERDSIDGIFEAIRDWKPKSTTSMTILVFIYDFTTLDRHVAEQSMRKLLSGQFSF